MKRALLLSFVVAAGCRSTPPASVQPATTVEGVEGDDNGFVTSAEHAAVAPAASGSQAAASTNPERLVAEGLRELRAMKSTRYRHKTHVDEASGIFEYDCSGFVAYALRAAVPDALAAIPVGPKGRPKAEHFATYFSGLTGDTGPWKRVGRMSDVRSGDVIAWLKPAEVDNSNTGHIVIAIDTPKKIKGSDAVTEIGGVAEWLVRVVDSTESPHADDVRGDSTTTGLGTGTIGIVVDGADTPLGYRWKGGRSAKAFATMVAIGRLR